MNWLKSVLLGRKEPFVHKQHDIRFLCEQDGPPEGELKSLWIPLLAERNSVRTAYLALVTYDKGKTNQVTLCISNAHGDDSAIVDELAKPFRKIFNAGIALDILFLQAEQELELRRVCAPFYEAR